MAPAVVTAAKETWNALRASVAHYLANDDPLAKASNAGAFLVWSSQPLYPVYVWLLVGRDAWPSLLTWLSTPLFFSVPLVARRSSIGGRALFVVAGVANTLLSTKAFGLSSDVAWFLLPCFVIAAGFFHRIEWKVAAALSVATLAAGALATQLGEPLHGYTPAQYTSLAHLNLWSVVVLSGYLAYAAIRARRAR
jgi:hypothetical protein